MLLSGCTSKNVPQTNTYKYVIEASFTCEIAGNYEVQRLGSKWQSVYLFQNVMPGSYLTDSIPFVSGLYRIKGEGEITKIFLVK